MLNEANVWDILTAIGTVGAVVVSVTLALRESAKSKRVESRMEKEREERSSAERRSTASLVAGWTESTYEASGDGSHYLRIVTAHLANESNEPVFGVTVSVALGVKGPAIGPLAIPLLIPVLPARHHRTWDITSGLLAHSVGTGDIPTEPVIGLEFSDSFDQEWVRDYSGALELRRLGSRSLEAGGSSESQIGPMENGFNPLFAATAFSHLIREAESLADVRGVLAPSAKGWNSMSKTEFETLRDSLANYGIATYVWYPTPRVAYVRLIHDDDIEKVRKGEGGRMQVLTLILIAGSGWKVFSVGAGVTEPDWIEYPRKDLHKDIRG